MADRFSQYKRTFKKGTILYKEGDKGNEIFLIQSGLIKLQLQAKKRILIVSILGKGDFFGDIGVLQDQTRFTQAEILQKAELIIISRFDFEKMILHNTEIAFRLLKKYCSRMKKVYMHMTSVLSDDEKGRVLNVITDLMHQFGIKKAGKIIVPFSVTTKDIAGLSGAQFALTQKIVNDLISGGMILLEEEQMSIINKEKLFKFIEYFNWRKRLKE